LSVFRSSKHIYAQIISDESNKTLLAVSTLDKEVIAKPTSLEIKEGSPSSIKSRKSAHSARIVGMLLAKKAVDQKISSIVFDRNGYKYCGRVMALADGAREGGLDF
jgi:large subunit ribosomal protein L18